MLPANDTAATNASTTRSTDEERALTGKERRRLPSRRREHKALLPLSLGPVVASGGLARFFVAVRPEDCKSAGREYAAKSPPSLQTGVDSPRRPGAQRKSSEKRSTFCNLSIAPTSSKESGSQC
jgi:hypothetical protein